MWNIYSVGVLVSVSLFGLNSAADPGKICVWIKNGEDETCSSESPTKPSFLWMSWRRVLCHKRRKNIPEPKDTWKHVLSPLVLFFSPFIQRALVSTTTPLLHILPSDIFCLGVGLCYLLLFISARNLSGGSWQLKKNNKRKQKKRNTMATGVFFDWSLFLFSTFYCFFPPSQGAEACSHVVLKWTLRYVIPAM